MIALVDLLDEHSGAIEYDLLRLGKHIGDLGTTALSWRDLWVLVTHAQPDTATFKALNPDWQHTLEIEFLRSIEYTNRWAQWAQTADATGETPKPSRRKPRNVPVPVPLPWDPVVKEEPKPTAMTIAEANEWLGWNKPGEAVAGG